jgi:hypothetical protein
MRMKIIPENRWERRLTGSVRSSASVMVRPLVRHATFTGFTPQIQFKGPQRLDDYGVGAEMVPVGGHTSGSFVVLRRRGRRRRRSHQRRLRRQPHPPWLPASGDGSMRSPNPTATGVSGVRACRHVTDHPVSRARETFGFYRDLTQQAPDELTVYMSLLASPGAPGETMVAMVACYCGDSAGAEADLKPLRQFGPPVTEHRLSTRHSRRSARACPTVATSTTWWPRTGGRCMRSRALTTKGSSRSSAATIPATSSGSGSTTTSSHKLSPACGPVVQYVMPGNCSRASSSWLAHSRGQPKARAAWPLRSAAAAPLVKWTYSPQFIRRV